MKKILVVYYSKTGNTKKIAEKISKLLNADIDEIIVKEKQISPRENFKMNYKKNPSDYDLIIIGTPVWGLRPVPAIKRYLTENENKIKKIAFFCTCGAIQGFTFSQMKKLSKNPIATLKIKQKKINLSDKKIKEFCERLK